MSTEAQREVYRAHRDAQTRYNYFLLAAAGAAIGFAVTQTQSAKLGWQHAPIAIAVLLWAGSFYSGCRHLGFVMSGLYANAAFLDVTAEPYGPHQRDAAEAAAAGLKEAIDKNSNNAHKYGNLQFRLLIAGSAAFIVWHAGQMYLRSLDGGIFV